VQAQLPEKAFDPVGANRHLLLFYFAIIKISNIKKTARWQCATVKTVGGWRRLNTYRSSYHFGTQKKKSNRQQHYSAGGEVCSPPAAKFNHLFCFTALCFSLVYSVEHQNPFRPGFIV
jgi:hypothetical protein